jgi:rhodanese-related sulfurtransferase
VSSKSRRQNAGQSDPARDPGPGPARPRAAGPVGQPSDSRAGIGLIIVVLVLATIVVIGADFLFGAVAGGGAGPSPTATPASAVSSFGVIVPGKGGSWVNVSPDQLAGMLGHKDFTLVGVKTPYMGEIDGTDLYIPYDQIAARSSELPADKVSRILVYCRSGAQSAQAAQTLLNLGYTNVWNLDGGMNAWQASGRALVDKNR